MPEQPQPKPTTRYRLLEFCPGHLDYPSGRVLLTFRADSDHSWVYYAQKENEPASFLEIMRRPTMFEWAQARFSGFDVESGSPADKIMRRLVRDGHAVQMAPNETFSLGRARKTRYH